MMLVSLTSFSFDVVVGRGKGVVVDFCGRNWCADLRLFVEIGVDEVARGFNACAVFLWYPLFWIC